MKDKYWMLINDCCKDCGGRGFVFLGFESEKDGCPSICPTCEGAGK